MRAARLESSHDAGVSYVWSTRRSRTARRRRRRPPPALAYDLYPEVDGAPAAWSNGSPARRRRRGDRQRRDAARLRRLAARAGRARPARTARLTTTYGHGTLVAGSSPGRAPTALRRDRARRDRLRPERRRRRRLHERRHRRADWVLRKRLTTASVSSTSRSPSRPELVHDERARPGGGGGSGSGASSSSRPPGTSGPTRCYFAPGNDPFAITVGASDPNDTPTTADDTLASFSSYGTTAGRLRQAGDPRARPAHRHDDHGRAGRSA